MTDTAPETVEWLYGTFTGEDLRGYLVDRVIPFRITRKTPKRIFYVRWEHPDGSVQLGSINRQDIEAHGHIYTRRYGHPDQCLYLQAPDLEAGRRTPSLADLKAAMADAHPDRGGSDADFIAARTRYLNARARPRG